MANGVVPMDATPSNNMLYAHQQKFSNSVSTLSLTGNGNDSGLYSMQVQQRQAKVRLFISLVLN